MVKTVKIEARITKRLFDELDKMVELGIYKNKDEAIMDGIRQAIERIKRIKKEEKVIIEDVKWGLYGD